MSWVDWLVSLSSYILARTLLLSYSYTLTALPSASGVRLHVLLFLFSDVCFTLCSLLLRSIIIRQVEMQSPSWAPPRLASHRQADQFCLQCAPFLTHPNPSSRPAPPCSCQIYSTLRLHHVRMFMLLWICLVICQCFCVFVCLASSSHTLVALHLAELKNIEPRRRRKRQEIW